jgi:hypothetical protein
MPLHVINEVNDDPQLPILIRQVTLTDAEVKDLPSTYLEIIAAPGANKMILFHSAVGVLDATAGAYSDVELNGGVMFAHGIGGGSLISTVGLIAMQATKQILSFQPLHQDLTVGPYTGYAYDLGSGSASFMINQPLCLIAYNNLDFGGGNAANTLKLSVYYSIIDI